MQIVKKILGQPLFKISSLNAVSVLVRIAGGLIVSKIIAKYMGPGGMAVVGNLRTFLNSLEGIVTMGVQNGIIKYTAENEKDEQKLYGILSTVFISLFTVILIVSFLLFAFSGFWSQWVFEKLGWHGEYAWIFYVLAFSLPWYAGSLIFMAVLTGLGNYKQVILLNIVGNIIGTVMSAFLIWKYATDGALLGLILFQSVFFLFSFYIVCRRFPKLAFLRWKYFDYRQLRNFSSYSLMTLVTSFTGPYVIMSIRNKLAEDLGAGVAGFWESINRISSFYLLFAVTMLTVYFFPKLSAAKTSKDTKSVFSSYYKTIVPLFALGLVIVYFLRDIIVRLLFTEEFLPMENLFYWQLIGDFFKVCSLIFGYEFFAKKLTKAYIVTEIMSFVILYCSSFILIEKYGGEGAVVAHALTYFIYLAVLIVYFRKTLKV